MNAGIEPLKPFLTAGLFPKLDGMLLGLLRSLVPADWEKQTVSPRWRVKDVAAHLLDTALRGVHVLLFSNPIETSVTLLFQNYYAGPNLLDSFWNHGGGDESTYIR